MVAGLEIERLAYHNVPSKKGSTESHVHARIQISTAILGKGVAVSLMFHI